MGLWLDRGRECDNLHQAIEIQIIQYLCGTDSPVSVALNTPLDRPIDRALRGFFIRFCYPSVTRPPKWRLLVTNKPIYHSELQPILERSNRFCIGKKEPLVKVGVIRNANFTKDFKLDFSNIECIDVEQRAFSQRHLLNGDLIVEKSGGSDKNPVGRAVLYEGTNGVFSYSNFTMVLRIIHREVILSKFLYYYILANYQAGVMNSMQTQTTGLHNLILDKYLTMPLYLPPRQEQERIINKIEILFSKLDTIMESL